MAQIRAMPDGSLPVRGVRQTGRAILVPELREAARYFLASGVAFAVDAGLLIFCTEVVGLHYLVSATIGFIVGIAVIYALSIAWVFEFRSLQNRKAERLVFVLIGVFGLAINDAVLFALTDLGGIRYEFSKLGAAAVVFSFNFTARKLALFRRPATEPSEAHD